MPRKPNYDFDKRERERLKAEKSAERARLKKEKADLAKGETTEAGNAPSGEAPE